MLLYSLGPRRKAPPCSQAAIPLCSHECPWDTPCHRNKLITHVQWLPGVPLLPNNFSMPYKHNEKVACSPWIPTKCTLLLTNVFMMWRANSQGTTSTTLWCAVELPLQSRMRHLQTSCCFWVYLEAFFGIGGLGEMADHKVFCVLSQPAGGLHLCLHTHDPPEAELMAISRIRSVPVDSNMLVSKPQEYTRGNMCACVCLVRVPRGKFTQPRSRNNKANKFLRGGSSVSSDCNLRFWN